MEFISLNSVDDGRIAIYAQLTNHQLRNALDPSRGILIAESETVVRVALEAGLEPISFLIEARWRPQFEERIAPFVSTSCEVFVLDTNQMSKLTGYSLTRGILAAMRRPALQKPEDVLAGAQHVAVLENISDTTNMGALIRSAAALGVDAVLLSPECADPYTRRAIRVSMGTVFKLELARFADANAWPQEACHLMRSSGFSLCALALADHALQLGDPQLAQLKRCALFFGAEGTGLSQTTIDACDYVVRIPMARGVDSLNVAAASAVAFWELIGKTQTTP